MDINLINCNFGASPKAKINSNYPMKRLILVTGGTGYIGSHTVVELQNAGFDVVIIDDLSNSSADVVDNIEKISGIRPAFEQFNLQDGDRLDAFFAKNSGIEAIIHFAASKAVGESVEKPLLYYRNNLVSLMNLLDGMSKYGIQNLVFSSSCTVYGQPDHLPVTESTPRKEAESPYGNTKAMSEDIIRDFIKANPGQKAIALRYFNPIGAHPTALIGELPRGIPNNLVPYITQTAAGIRKQLSVFGDDYNTPDGSCIRDFINVVDLAKAHVVAIERLLKSKNDSPYEYFNVGTGKGASVLELITTFEKATGVKLNYKIVGRRSGDIEKIYADTTNANKVLGWKAEIPLDETLKSAWNWEKRLRGIN
jgi:UDP-glucose 4-epimerase